MKATQKDFTPIEFYYNKDYQYKTGMWAPHRVFNMTPFIYGSNKENIYKIVFMWQLVFNTPDRKLLLFKCIAEHEYLIDFDGNNDIETLTTILNESCFKYEQHLDKKKPGTFFSYYVLESVDFKKQAQKIVADVQKRK